MTTNKIAPFVSLLAGLLVTGVAATAHAEWYSCVVSNQCIEQDGSYAAVCGGASKVANARCSDICDASFYVTSSEGSFLNGSCVGGCFSNYNSSQSWQDLASTYDCSVPAPTATDVFMGYDSAAGKLVGSANVSNGHDATNISTYVIYAATSSSGANSVALIDTPDTNAVSVAQALSSGYTWFMFCVEPEVYGWTGGDGGYGVEASGSKVCTGWGKLDEQVTASNVQLTISGDMASGSYTYADNYGVAEETSNTLWKILRADDANGTNATTIITSNNWTLMPEDNEKYLQFCVMPRSQNTTATSYTCSPYTWVGHLVELYKDNLGGTNVNIAYESSSWGHCFNLTDYSFNDMLSSYVWYSSSSSNGTTVWFYQDINCSGNVATRTLAPNSTDSVYSINATMGTSWNDQVSSIKVTW